MNLSVPGNDPNLPSYQNPEYCEAQPDLQLVWDIWRDLKDSKQSYLPREEAEPPRAYQNRLARSQFDNRFNPAIKGHAGLLSEFSLSEDVASSIQDHEANIDLQGNDLTTFLTDCDEAVLRDGGCGILVEFQPEDESVVTTLDLAQSGRRPYLVRIDRRDILNWDVTYINGKPVINRVAIREHRMVPSGAFGVEAKTLYRVLRPGTFEVHEIIQVKAEFQLVLRDSGTTSLEAVPLVWYSISESGLFCAPPPFSNLARLNIEHLQKRSSLNEVLWKCNMPIPVRKGMIKGLQDLLKQLPRLILGPNSVLDIPNDGDFYFAEPTGNAIAATQADIEKLETSMDRVSLAFLTGGEGQKTATEVVLDSAQTQATLKGMARRKESCVQEIFQCWASYTGELTGGAIEVNDSILQVPATAQDIQVILGAMGAQISRELGLKMLLQRRWLPADTDMEEEAANDPAPPPQVVKVVANPSQPVRSGSGNDLFTSDGSPSQAVPVDRAIAPAPPALY